MKTEDLKALGLTDEQVQRVFAMNGADVNREKQAAETAKAERDAMRTQLKGYDPDWQQKATDAQKAADAKVAELQAGYAAQNILPNCVKNARSSLTISALRAITWGNISKYAADMYLGDCFDEVEAEFMSLSRRT